MTPDQEQRIKSLREKWATEETRHTGSLTLFKHNPMCGTLLTFGTKTMATMFDCFWLFDIIGSAQAQFRHPHKRQYADSLQVWHVDVIFPSTRTVVWMGDPDLTEDESREKLNMDPCPLPFVQELDGSTFPLDNYTFMVEPDGEGHMVIMLPGER